MRSHEDSHTAFLLQLSRRKVSTLFVPNTIFYERVPGLHGSHPRPPRCHVLFRALDNALRFQGCVLSSQILSRTPTLVALCPCWLFVCAPL
ncbi:hypothetical protein PHLGIDRAFT_381593 [Phlebiopsis gigantea 11061_1 CR5-6]|uniref:Uncharacterized protein n=1 Tax=Phlebiopsis gigantea (strain 11061_1 CR5-6) TaxID=745531 RepID=A0A0C3NT69_PHLG1|nr:hypothetical protein PHLGIDRAFT_381593 [Phlebiopsis gigantea 11061_1 CR5-6]